MMSNKEYEHRNEEEAQADRVAERRRGIVGDEPTLRIVDQR